ncbi:MAG: GNAT family N-acetyltransferase [Acidimicrobiia bacterium]|nr:GNAT family N-acetyltransferase [Acidimicrobiia bacterium]
MVESTESLRPADAAQVRTLLEDAFAGRFAEADWQHCLGGTHVILRSPNGLPIAHAAVVLRVITVNGTDYRTGYVEGVGTSPDHQGDGHGTAVMTEANRIIRSHFELGALATGEHHFYERLGWERWAGKTYVADGNQLRRTPDEDDGIMVLRFGRSGTIDLRSSIACTARIGDDW